MYLRYESTSKGNRGKLHHDIESKPAIRYCLSSLLDLNLGLRKYKKLILGSE
jgi:hypothetical protein